LGVIDQWTAFVGAYTERVAPKFARDPAAYENSKAYFALLTMVTALQRGIGIAYDPGLIDEEDFFRQPENVFIHGVVLQKRGTCSSLPPLYVAIGRRLGYPLKLVSTKCHLFARWDDPSGERWNLECTCPGLNCYSDDHYRQWPIPITPEEENRFGWLKSKTPAQEVALFWGMRGHCWLANGQFRDAAACYDAAGRLDPENELPALSASWAAQLADSSTTGNIERTSHV
jgi:regulator of sirC expression with transglutaminase-like and TPR domain